MKTLAFVFLFYALSQTYYIDELRSTSRNIESIINNYKKHSHDFLVTKFPECMEDAFGILLHWRCCVFYSNIVATLLHLQYGVDRRIYKKFPAYDENFQVLPRDFSFMDYIEEKDFMTLLQGFWQIWAVKNEYHQPIYSSFFNISKVYGKLVKCEIGDFHSFLKFIPENETMPEVIVDFTYLQLFFPLELGYEPKIAPYLKNLEFLKTQKEYFVGTVDEITNMFTTETFEQNLECFRNYTGNRGNVEDGMQVKDVVKAIRSIYTSYDHLCGHPVQFSKKEL